MALAILHESFWIVQNHKQKHKQNNSVFLL